jgi:FkbM family methyltransferase
VPILRPMLSTAAKIRVAKTVASALLRLGLRPVRRIRRRGIMYEIDIREGIDLSLFLFGVFQRHVLRVVWQFIPSNGVALDVGANIGALTLPTAAHLRHGHVYAFEPTDFAYFKLRRNLELNPPLAQRVTPIKSFVADSNSPESSMVAYSSWPVVDAPAAALHPIHKGVAKAASSDQMTIDAFVRDRSLTRLSLIKIDTDGHEFAVLSGALDSLKRFRPVVVLEACEYLMRPPRSTFMDFEALFRGVDYRICSDGSLRSLSAEEFHGSCPAGGGLDLVAVPNEYDRA